MFVWNYDWRKKIADNVFVLNSFVADHVGQNDRLVLIGHSEGGLLARAWAQQNSFDTGLKNVITLGSQHIGLVDAYDSWA